ncbi:hypothetical protein CA13_07470 [Planctomycetes bacterium CA13]|uniref:Uncharacterized protein n=1 Tax=Novipirellula herctigrandis TaxID=2527986 RepID=A0A5C5YWF4_9BACT|nr:hypothetical protein CA13_07470 [Planctomycetes bacterium CA13]
MSNDNPFSQSHTPPPIPPNSRANPTHSNKRIFVVLGVIALFTVMLCGGLGVVGFIAMQRIAQPPSDVTLPETPPSFPSDLANFNQSLAKVATDPLSDLVVPQSSLDSFIRKSADALVAEEDVPFSSGVFIEAVGKSEFCTSDFGLIERITMRNWLNESPIFPEALDAHYRILDVRLDASGDLAEVDLLSYSADNQVETIQWFLVKEEGKWRFYDWQRLEFGRRESDEYAAYLKGEPPVDDGYYTALELLVDAETAWQEDRHEEARQIVRSAESTLMLAADRPSFQLRTAHSWMRMYQYAEAIAAMKAIQDPDAMLGVWPSMAVCLWSLDQNEEALQAALKSQNQSPDHPNTQWILSEIYNELGRDDESADLAIKALPMIPHDPTVANCVLRQSRPKDVEVLLNVQQKAETENGWTRILDTAADNTKFGEALLNAIETRSDLPMGLADMAAANLAWSNNEYEAAAIHFLAAQKTVKLEELAVAASNDYLALRLQESEFKKLFAESTDIEATTQKLVRRAYDDALYSDTRKLIDALSEQTDFVENPWAAGLRGFAFYEDGQNESALADFETFLAWQLNNTNAIEEDDQWIKDTTEYYIATTLLKLGRPADVTTRWPDDLNRHWQVGDYLLTSNRPEIATAFLNATSKSPSDSVRLQQLRLLAHQAYVSNDPVQGDQLYLDALDLSNTVIDDDQSYLRPAIVRRWANDCVLSQSKPPKNLDQLAHESIGPFISTAVEESVRLRDPNQCAQWQAVANQMGVVSGDIYASIRQEVGMLEWSQGNADEAASALKECVAHTDSDETWLYDDRIQNAITAMARAGRIEEAREWLASIPPTDDAIPLTVSLDLATGQFDNLNEAMDALDRDEATRFLNRSFNNSRLQWYCNQPKLIDLLKKFPLVIGSNTASSGDLVMGDGGEISGDAIEQLLEAALGEPFSAEPFDGQSRKLEQAWLASSQSGNRILILWSHPEYELKELPKDLQLALDQKLRRMSIEIIDENPKAEERLFKIAAQAAGKSAILFTWSPRSHCWTGPELRRRLEWDGRVPLGLDIPNVDLVEKAIDTDSPDPPTIDDWEKRLTQQGAPLSVTLSVPCENGVEKIPAEIVRVDVDNYDIFVRPKQDSKINPLVQAGIEYTCYAGYLE